ncbi:MAG: hypothetical protein KatS3mg105_4163 [Gemmatales bacterium]|nr:MAG: hypothetical protein KatS3mg105_4163 [Gemmatales bacterium]
MALDSVLLAVIDTADSVSILDPAPSDGGGPAYWILNLFYLICCVTGVIFIVVQGMLVYCTVRFRKTKDDDDSEPPQVYGSTPIEVAWTVAPLLTVFVIFLVVVRTVVEIRVSKPPPNSLPVTVVGHQWWWEFRYPDPKNPEVDLAVTANELHVPAGRPIFLRLESVDVIHSFWIPRLAGKTDVVPGHPNHMWFRTKEAGLFQGQCAEYCGTQHANMLLNVYVDEPETFQRWLENERRPARDGFDVRKGKEKFLSLACVGCHTVRGTPARGLFGPDLTHLMSRRTLASGMVPNDQEHLHRWGG